MMINISNALIFVVLYMIYEYLKVNASEFREIQLNSL